MPEPRAAAHLTVVVLWAPRQSLEVQIDWTPGLGVAQALAHAMQSSACAPEVLAQIQAAPLQASVWGKRVRADHALQPLDRLEFTRPLRVDPKVARRERFHKQGSRSAGLFALKPK